MKDYSPGRPSDQDLCTPVIYLWKIIRLGDLATRICAPLSYTYEPLFAWASWPPGYVHPCPIPMNHYSPGRTGDHDMCTPVLYLWTIIRPGDLATRICAPLSYTYEPLDVHLNADDTNTEFYVKPRLWHNVGTSHWFVWIASKLSSVVHLLCSQELHMISLVQLFYPFRSIRLWHCALDMLIARERERESD
jgi:hypothetical protein